MTLEDQVSALNEHFFFKEFTYSDNTFSPRPSTELELADSIIWIDDMLIVFQLKGRQISSTTSPDRERSWFHRKVVSLGTKQIRDTVNYLNIHRHIVIKNHRGHEFELDTTRINTIHKIVSYLGSPILPQICRQKKHHNSRTLGTIHLIPAHDYLGIVRTVLTPYELSDYLHFRKQLIDEWGDIIAPLPESALVGQYLTGQLHARPTLDFIDVLESLDHRADEWDMSGIIDRFPDRITEDNSPTDYYSIVTELAKLTRSELREYKMRLQLSMEESGSVTPVAPYRMAVSRTNCAFVFVPVPKHSSPWRRQGLVNFTLACKYDLRMRKCIGVSVVVEDAGSFSAGVVLHGTSMEA